MPGPGLLDAPVRPVTPAAGALDWCHYARRSVGLKSSTVHRYYHPATGQFLSVDPAVGLTSQPYAYTGDDPVNNTDPTGMITCPSWVPGCGVVTNIQHHWRGIAQGVEIGAGALASAGCIAATAGICGTVVGTVLTVGGIGGVTGAGFYSASSGPHTVGGYAQAFGFGSLAGGLSAGCALSFGAFCATAAGGFIFNSAVGAGIGGYGYLHDACQPSVPGFIESLLWGAIQNEPVPVPDSWLP